MQLQSFVAGSWQAGRGGGVALRDATTGEVIARAERAGPRYARDARATRARWAAATCAASPSTSAPRC